MYIVSQEDINEWGRMDKRLTLFKCSPHLSDSIWSKTIFESLRFQTKEKKKVGPPFRFKEKTTVQVKFTPPASKEEELRSMAARLFNKWIKEGV